MNALILISITSTLIWCNLSVIVAFRFIYGVATGIMINCSNFMIMEMVPKEKHSNFMYTVNLGFNLGFCLCLMLGLQFSQMNDQEKA